MTRSYDITLLLHLDATFSPSEIASVTSIRTTVVEVDANGNAVPSNIKLSNFPLEGIERGPGSVYLTIPDKEPLSDTLGYYSVQVSNVQRMNGTIRSQI